MKSKRVFQLVIAVILYFSSASLSLAYDNSEQQKIAALEARVKDILARDNVSQRPDVNDIFELADIFASRGEIIKAAELYRAGLSIDSFQYKYQMKFANLLKASGDVNQAIEKYKSVYTYAEDEQVINSAKSQLLSLKVECPTLVQNESKFSIVVVPFGKINRVLIDELLLELNRATGIKYVLSDNQLPVGKLDRTYAAKYLSEVCKKIKLESPGIIPPPDTDPNAQMRFLIGILHAEGVGQDKIDDFRTKLINDFQVGQRNADRFIAELKEYCDSINKPGIVGFLGITESDIYSRDNNFLFGWAQTRFGVMSYCRFKAGFNEEREYRPRLLKRAIKQGLASTFHILGIPDCTTAMCARAYPHSLEEHDLKELQLCSWCREQLSKKLKKIL